MRAVFVFVGLLLLACTSSPPAEAAARRDAQALAGKTVALVRDDGEGGIRAFCTGVWVSPRTILTAFHCVDEETVIGYVTREDIYPAGSATANETAQARGSIVYMIDPDHDLALLRAVAPPAAHGIAHTRIGTLAQGMGAQVMGHSLGLWWSYSSGDIAAIREIDLGDGPMLWVQTTAPTSPGNSGGGLFDDDGSLIGICHGSFTRGQLLNLFVHPRYIDAMLDRARKAGAL